MHGRWKWEKTKRGWTGGRLWGGGLLHIRHAAEETEIKREKKHTQDFPGMRKQESRTRMTGSREGIKQGISTFTQLCIAE